MFMLLVCWCSWFMFCVSSIFICLCVFSVVSVVWVLLGWVWLKWGYFVRLCV